MKINKRIIIPAIIIVLLIAAVLFLRVFYVNVIFERCVTADEAATAIQNTSFRSYQYSSISSNGSTMSMTDNTQLLGTPLTGEALERAIADDTRTTGIAIIDGGASLLDMIKLNKSPFVHHIVIYFPIFDGGDRDITARSVTRFYENNPEARYW